MICRETIPCGTKNSHIGICTNCTEKIHLNPRFINYKFNNISIPTLIMFDYEGDMRNILINMKFENRPENARYLGNILADFLNNSESMIENKSDVSLDDIKKFLDNVDCLVQSPMHKKKYRQRGYNQSFLLSQELSIITNLKIYKNAVIKIKNTQPQSSLDGEARKYNLTNSLLLGSDKKHLFGKNVMIVDDIVTTGNTLKEIALELNNCDIKTIRAFAIASTSGMINEESGEVFGFE